MSAAHIHPGDITVSERAVTRFCCLCQKMTIVDPEVGLTSPFEPQRSVEDLGTVPVDQEHRYYDLMFDHVSKDMHYTKCVCTHSGCDAHFVREEDLYRHQRDTRHRVSRREAGSSLIDVFLCSVAHRNMEDVRGHPDEQVSKSQLDSMCFDIASRLLSKLNYDTLGSEAQKACVRGFKAYWDEQTNKQYLQQQAENERDPKKPVYEAYKVETKNAASASKPAGAASPATGVVSARRAARIYGRPKMSTPKRSSRNPSPIHSSSDSEYQQLTKKPRRKSKTASCSKVLPPSDKPQRASSPVYVLLSDDESTPSALPDVSKESMAGSAKLTAAAAVFQSGGTVQVNSQPTTTSRAVIPTSASTVPPRPAFPPMPTFDCKLCEAKMTMLIKLKRHLLNDHKQTKAQLKELYKGDFLF